MARIGVVGGGAFGTAMACVLRRSGHDIVIWAREPEVVSAINRDAANPHFLPGIALVPGIAATNDLAATTADADFLLLAPPAQRMRSVTTDLRPFLKAGLPVVTCSSAPCPCWRRPGCCGRAMPRPRRRRTRRTRCTWS